MTSPTFNISLNSFLIQDIFSYLIIPSTLFSVSISTENLLIFFIIAKFQLIDFSNLNFSILFFQFDIFFSFNNGPRHPFLLS